MSLSKSGSGSGSGSRSGSGSGSTISRVVCDWDETITAEDTIKLVAQAAYKRKPDFTPLFAHFTDVYLRAYNKFEKSYTFNEESTSYCAAGVASAMPMTTIESADAWTAIKQEISYQQELKQVELTSINEIVDRKLFTQVSIKDFEQQASKVVIRPGFWDFLKECRRLHIPVTVLSVNWTLHIIRAVLEMHGHSVDGVNLLIIVNEFKFDTNHVCTGEFDLNLPSLRTGFDKLKIIQQQFQLGKDVLYIGDSRTDLLAMIQCDFGIIIKGGSASIKAKKLGIPILELSVVNPCDPKLLDSKVLYETDSWIEVLNYINKR